MPLGSQIHYSLYGGCSAVYLWTSIFCVCWCCVCVMVSINMCGPSDHTVMHSHNTKSTHTTQPTWITVKYLCVIENITYILYIVYINISVHCKYASCHSKMMEWLVQRITVLGHDTYSCVHDEYNKLIYILYFNRSMRPQRGFVFVSVWNKPQFTALQVEDSAHIVYKPNRRLMPSVFVYAQIAQYPCQF